MIQGNAMSLYHAQLSNGEKRSLSATSLNLARLLFQRQLPSGTYIVFINEHNDPGYWQPRWN
jgi:hypothetical protein